MPRTPKPSPLQPRKAPSQSRSEQTVAAIIEAAAQVLELHGLEGYNTNAVAARAGVSVGSLYQYFPSKDALTVALMQRETAQFRMEAEAAFAMEDGRAALEHYIAAAVRQQLARPRVARLLDIEESRAAIQEALGKSSVADDLAAALQRGHLPKLADPRRAAMDLAAIIRGLTDGAGERGETDLVGLRIRIDAAVFGYLDRVATTPPSSRGDSRPKASPKSSNRG